MRVAYEDRKFGPQALHTIRLVNRVLDDYAEQGFDLTLRQLYYQFVAHDLFPDDRVWLWVEATKKWVRGEEGDPLATKNADPNYKWLGDIVSNGRMSGHIDWERIVDRTRELEELSHWESPAQVVEIAAKQYRVERWKDQPYYVEVWIEKDALTGVIAGTCESFDVPYFSCRGYTSLSEMWVASQRLLTRLRDGKRVRILHLGDHDPSGIDMTRDIEDRLTNFMLQDYLRAVAKDEGVDPYTMSKENIRATLKQASDLFEVERIALNMDQVRQYRPPPNPAKMTDSRYRAYLETHGDESWELDALDPATLASLISTRLDELIEPDAWAASQDQQDEERAVLFETAEDLR